ncbi:hypothetical protein KUTeg_011961 [Tegillarca granosa]|uniref:Sushi domain-containing protein n=1 Tax=Tegillarca granosa TaxID=220873 RepID=A0ABQ9F0K9_TEGGR|nr:hypothetical protein KUTeg_011961 [Tegillarca granosa]
MCYYYYCCLYYYAWWYGHNYCHNGGTSFYNGTQYICLCNQGWDPTTCCQSEINKDPCDDVNTELKSLELRTSSTPNIGLCDQNLTEKWYKAYGYEMITRDPGSNRCGSKNPIYLTGTIPNDTDVHNLTACLRDQEDACTTNLSVLVKKCDADTIFYLSPSPTSNSTYCFDQVDMSDKATTWTASSMHMRFNMTWSNTATPKPGIVYRCDFRFSTGNLWYKIKWYINDIKVAESEYVQKDSVGIAENTTLTEKYIEAYGVTIKCSVTAAYSAMSPPGAETKSPGFYAGMKLHTPSISIERGKSGIIIMEPTIPYGCPSYSKYFVCKTRILMSDPQARNQCDKSQIVITSTQNDRYGLEMEGGLITNTEWFENELWRKNYTFTIKHREEDQRYIPRKTSFY